MLIFTQTENGMNIGITGNAVIGRMYAKQDTGNRNRHKLVLEIKDVGNPTFDAVLAAFKFARDMGEIPVID